MASNPYRKTALLDALGVSEDDDPQQIDPVGPRIEEPPASPAAPVPPIADLPAAGGYTPIRGAKAGQDSVILGYKGDKINDTSYHTGKYNDEIRAFKSGLDADVGVSRGGLGNMLSYLQNEQGYKDATATDQKIDFDGPNGPLPPIDVIRGGDNAIVFQDPRGAEPGAAGGGGGGDVGGGLGSLLGGLNPALSGDPMAAIQAQLGQLTNSPTLMALLKQLGAV